MRKAAGTIKVLENKRTKKYINRFKDDEKKVEFVKKLGNEFDYCYGENFESFIDDVRKMFLIYEKEMSLQKTIDLWTKKEIEELVYKKALYSVDLYDWEALLLKYFMMCNYDTNNINFNTSKLPDDKIACYKWTPKEIIKNYNNIYSTVRGKSLITYEIKTLSVWHGAKLSEIHHASDFQISEDNIIVADRVEFRPSYMEYKIFSDISKVDYERDPCEANFYKYNVCIYDVAYSGFYNRLLEYELDNNVELRPLSVPTYLTGKKSDEKFQAYKKLFKDLYPPKIFKTYTDINKDIERYIQWKNYFGKGCESETKE